MVATLNSGFSTHSIAVQEDDPWSDLAILVRRAQRGDRSAFGELAVQFEGTVRSICLRRLGNPSEAAELTQEVFLHVMKRIGQLREPERFAGWLRQVAARMAINRATRRLPTPSVDSEILDAAGDPEASTPLDSLISRERAEMLRDGLARLKQLDRETLLAFYIHGYSLVEIAERDQAPVGTIKRRLHTARKRLRDVLEDAVADADDWGGSSSDTVDDEELVTA
ncbi:MAG: sigma-70 family RNA polymerase sigma factor [Isosphaeraceae bacterium]|nr:sigma-70 family RNA polymerase sigma factor [Isosphaeraceae bacterium]